MAVDAIVRALYRMAVSRRHLLQWTTAATAQAQATTGFAAAAAPALEPAPGGAAAARRAARRRHPDARARSEPVPALGRVPGVDLVGQPAAAGAP